MLTKAAYTHLHCVVLGADFVRKAVSLCLVAPSVLTLGINGVPLLNLQQLMVFTLVEKINAVALL